MRNAEATKNAILNVSSELFNVQGYKATSISDITQKLGLTKGAIYRHFKNKEELEKAALIFMSKRMTNNLGQRIKMEKDVQGKMNAIFDYFMAYSIKSPEIGGCPLLNAAVEADDTNPKLSKLVNGIIDFIHSAISQVLQNGIDHGQLKKDVDVNGFSSLIFSSLEGAIMMTKITGSSTHMQVVVNHLRGQFNNMLL